MSLMMIMMMNSDRHPNGSTSRI